MRSDRLTKLADYLEQNVRDEWFNLQVWGDPGFERMECGTMGCAIGFYCTAFPDEGLVLRPIACGLGHQQLIVTTPDAMLPHWMIASDHSFKIIATHFGITYEQAIDLFSASRYSIGSRENVIMRIRRFVNTNRRSIHED